MSFWDAVWLIIISFAFIAYLMATFSIIVDLFRDRDLSGGMKAVWFICLDFFPFLTALVYLVVRGGGMAERSAKGADAMRAAYEGYIREVAGRVGGARVARGIARRARPLVRGVRHPRHEGAAPARFGRAQRRPSEPSARFHGCGDPESFYVLDVDGPLADGELDRASVWGHAVAASLQAHV